MQLKTISLLISLAGISLLFFLAYFLPPQQVNSYSELKENSFVQTSGKVISERNFSDFSIIKLDNDITITCNCQGFINKTIDAEGKVTAYEGELQITSYNIKEK